MRFQRSCRLPPAVWQWSVVILLGGLLLASNARAFEEAVVNRALATITGLELQRHVEVLADDTFEGREAGSRGGHAAAKYLAQQMEAAGLTPAGDTGSYFQSFGSGYRNILGLLKGSDPDLRHEIIVVGGHYDHVGYGSRRNSYGPIGYIHNGADDNASGVSGVLEVLDAMTQLPSPPRRSILFAFWDGEEKGLLGSKRWVTAPTLELDRVKFALNVDMIGRLRDERVEVFGIRSGYGLRQLVGRQNTTAQVRLVPTWELKSNSDHYSFYSHNIPVLMFHTGLHDDYHRPSDDTHLLNVDGMQRVAQLMFQVVLELSEQDEPIPFRSESASETEAARKALETPSSAPASRLGLEWDRAGEDVERETLGLLVTHVIAQSAADRAGIAVGDRIVLFEGEPIRNTDTFHVEVLAATRPIKLGVLRAEDPSLTTSVSRPSTIVVELDGKPVRIGISWRRDSGNPGTVIISSVTPGSAAEQAGLKPGDRIYEVAGQRYTSSEQLLEMLNTLPSPLRVLIEREGRVLEATLHLSEQGSRDKT